MTLFEGFRDKSDEEKDQIWDSGIFIIDTNILLNIYKYRNKDNYKNLLSILSIVKEKDKLYIPYHVGLEYYFNKDNLKDKKEKNYESLVSKYRSKINESKEKIKKDFESVEFYQRKIIDHDILDKAHRLLDNTVEEFNEFISGLKENTEDIINREHSIERLIDGIIGEPFNDKTIEEIEKAGKTRYQKEIPPGYKDAKTKSGSRGFGQYIYEEQYGDLIIWEHLIAQSKEHGRPVIFITEDNKSDWWYEVSGKTIGADPSLIQEFFEKTNQSIQLYSLSEFVKHALEKFDIKTINNEAMDDLIEESNEIPDDAFQDFTDKLYEVYEITDLINKAEKMRSDPQYGGIFPMAPEHRPRNIRSTSIEQTYNDESMAILVKRLLEAKYEDYIAVSIDKTNKKIYVQCIPLLDSGVKATIDKYL